MANIEKIDSPLAMVEKVSKNSLTINGSGEKSKVGREKGDQIIKETQSITGADQEHALNEPRQRSSCDPKDTKFASDEGRDMHKKKRRNNNKADCKKQAISIKSVGVSKKKNHRACNQSPPKESSDDELEDARQAWFANKEVGLRFHGTDEEAFECFRRMNYERKRERKQDQEFGRNQA